MVIHKIGIKDVCERYVLITQYNEYEVNKNIYLFLINKLSILQFMKLKESQLHQKMKQTKQIADFERLDLVMEEIGING